MRLTRQTRMVRLVLGTGLGRHFERVGRMKSTVVMRTMAVSLLLTSAVSGQVGSYLGPVTTAKTATNVGSTSATLNGRLIEDRGFTCSTMFRYRKVGGSTWTETSWTGSLREGTDFSRAVSGLASSTQYEYQCRAKYTAFIVTVTGDWSASVKFTTSTPPRTDPVAVTTGATNIQKTSATLNGKLTEDRGHTCSTKFRYRKVGVSTWIETSWTGSLRTGQSFSAAVSGLTSDTQYEYQCQARYSLFMIYVVGNWSSSATFKTGSSDPVATPTGATNPQTTSATLNGRVTQDAGETCQTQFRYRRVGVSAWTESSWAGSLHTGQSFSTTVNGLASDTQYEYQCRARYQYFIGPIPMYHEGPWSSSTTFKTSPTTTTIPVPNVVGMSQAQAEAALHAVGLQVGSISSVPSSQHAGTVVSQNPVAGTRVNAGSAVNLVLAQGSSGGQEGQLYTVGADGIHRISLAGSVEHLLALHKDSYDLEIRDNCLYVTEKTRGGAIFVYSLAGSYIESIPIPAAASEYLFFVALPERRFALLDNKNDKAFFIDENGTLLATTIILSPADSTLQTLKGVVVGNRLILSENGKRQVVAIDLTTYHASIFKDLSTLSGSLGDITYANGKYYIIAGGRSVYSFTESGGVTKVGEVPESNATGICVIGNLAYLSVNLANRIYTLDLGTGAVGVLVSGLNYPRDIECVESTGGTTGDCCGFQPGDRVVLLIDTPRDTLGWPAVGLHIGAVGTVVCCDRSDPDLPLFVSWDGWANGKNGDLFCDPPVMSYAPYSGWWMSCDDIAPWSGGSSSGGDSSCTVDFASYDIAGADLSPWFIQAGRTLSLNFGGANQGTTAIATGWRIRYYASVDTTITTADYFLSESVADFPIEPGTVLSLEESFTFPSGVPQGQYYVGWIFDPLNEICESNENNNTGYIKGTQLMVGY